ncbi:MAG TPA: hypothetical protein VGD67_25490, partial [Pseudonocardiaceae bacterium]
MELRVLDTRLAVRAPGPAAAATVRRLYAPFLLADGDDADAGDNGAGLIGDADAGGDGSAGTSGAGVRPW